MSTVYKGKASSFADPRDVKAFERCKAQGHSDDFCFGKGDNGIGCWGDNTKEGSGASCAVPPERMIERHGSLAAARLKSILVRANGKSATVLVKDRMPHLANIKNGAVIDLNADACRLLGLEPPVLVACEWEWE